LTFSQAGSFWSFIVLERVPLVDKRGKELLGHEFMMSLKIICPVDYLWTSSKRIDEYKLKESKLIQECKDKYNV